ncbi:uncharacterized protein LOC109533288 [Dendroctonus ponderosae]
MCEVDCIDTNIKRWIRDAFKDDKFKIMSIDKTGSTSEGEGYIGNISFVTVTALTPSNNPKIFNLVIKYAKSLNPEEVLLPFQLAYERENLIYGTVVPAFHEFEKQYNNVITDKHLPKCFGTLSYGKLNILILQNVKAENYQLHELHRPLNLEHLKLTFSSYGKWHGLSLAYRHHRPKKFENMFGNLRRCVLQDVMELSHKAVQTSEECMYIMLENNNELKIMEKLRKLFPDGFSSEIIRVLKCQADEEKIVLGHGDCWNNNFMYKYSELDQSKPESVLFLDFQISSPGSPVLDLSYHLYATASGQELAHLKELLDIYYSSLSDTLKKFDCDPEVVFPYSELVLQWKKYSAFGVMMAIFVLQFLLADKEDIVDFRDVGGDNFSATLLKLAKGNGRAYPRLLAAIKHYLDFEDF